MYSTCLFCNQSLGRNDAVEAFLVGRRLAFDAARGRLWVVCPKCERWNLTPLEERWEAIEQCERLFRDSRLRVSTDQIGLAKLREGLELVRIGEPQRPEMAAWRYGDQFGRRRRRNLLLVGGTTALSATTMLGPALALVVGGSATALVIGGMVAGHFYTQLRVTTRVTTAGGEPLALAPSDVRGVGLLPGDESGDDWGLSIPHLSGPLDLMQRFMTTLIVGGVPSLSPLRDTTVVRGPAALAAARVILPRLNTLGGSRRTVREAVARIDAEGTAERFFASSAREAGRAGHFADGWSRIADLPASLRLALEMAAHEESERRALEGELLELARAWQHAEEIAAIADDLLLPVDLPERLRQLRRP